MSKDTSGRSFGPRDCGARGDVLGSQKEAKWKSGEPGEATVYPLSVFGKVLGVRSMDFPSPLVPLNRNRRNGRNGLSVVMADDESGADDGAEAEVRQGGLQRGVRRGG